ncbi:MAG: rRNA maturation RNase YbeY [Patescibacteria group bacterium]|nr:rRNA maturation RNase YbeY [Patescibacteria group bacterium]
MIYCDVSQEVGKKIKDCFFQDIVRHFFKEFDIKDAEISIVIVNKNEIKKFNKNYRKQNRVTDVLSFIYNKKPLEGEILICYEKALQQAKENKIDLNQEIKLLLVHSLLHLIGYDHKNIKEANKMKKMENKILSVI